MDWVEGIPLDLYIDNCINDKYKLSQLAYRFSRLVLWLMPQPFAHGDLKPDNILVRTDGTLVLVDYDGMYVPAMKRQQAREIGSPDFRHPTRKIDNFDEHIDDFAISCILLSLKAISIEPTLYHQYAASGRLLFSEYDYRNFSKCEVVKQLYPSSDSEINILVSLFTIALERGRFDDVPFSLFYLREPEWFPQTEEEWDDFIRKMELEHFPYEEAWSMSFNEFMKQNSIVTCRKGSAYCSLTDGGEEAFIFYTKKGKKIEVINLQCMTIENFVTQKNSLSIWQMNSGDLMISGHTTKVTEDDERLAWTDKDGVVYSYDHKRLLKLNNDSLSEYEIPNGTEVICDGSLNNFYNKTEINHKRKITIPMSVVYIGRNPFFGNFDTIICNSPDFVVENGALYSRDKKLLISCFSKSTEFIIPDGVEQIGSFAFAGCSNIGRIFIPKSISYIGNNPFIGMKCSNGCLDVKCGV